MRIGSLTGRAGAAMVLAALGACAPASSCREVVAVDLGRGYAATQAALTDLNYQITERSRSPMLARVLARGVGGKDGRVDLEPEGRDRTEIRIRGGMLSDQEQAQAILAKIKSHF